MADSATAREMTVPVQRRPGYRMFPVARFAVRRAEYGHNILEIDAILTRRTGASCVATLFIPSAAARFFVMGAAKEHGPRDSNRFVFPALADTVPDRLDHQVLAVSGLFLRQPEANQDNRIFYVDCVMDSTLITEEQFVKRNDIWLPAHQGKQVFVREIVATFILQEPTLMDLYDRIETTVAHNDEENRNG